MDTTEVRPGARDTALLPAMGDACVSCGAGLHVDQRYCLECGARSGPPRLPFMDGRTRPDADAEPREPPAARAPATAQRAAPGITLIAGVATLLLAMGVGVIIGAAGGDAPTPAGSARVQVVSVPLPVAAAVAAAPATATTTPSTTPTAHGHAAKGAVKPAASSPSAKKTNVPKPVKVGSKGHGPGYKNGTFTGDFFGP